MGEDTPSSKVTLCDVQVCPPYMPPLSQLFHDQWSSEPTDTVFAAGENRSLRTETPPDGTGVLPVGGAVEASAPPPPPHPASAMNINETQAFLNIKISRRIFSITSHAIQRRDEHQPDLHSA